MRKELFNLREAIERREKPKGNENGAEARSASKEVEQLHKALAPTRNLPRLILLGRAKSELDYTGTIKDHRRAIITAGVDEARRGGAQLARRGWHFDSVLCSNVRRTTETLACPGSVIDDTKNEFKKHDLH